MSIKNIISRSSFYLNDIDKKTFAREELVYKTTEDLLIILEDHKISKTDLARKLGKSKSYVSQILSGSRNMTLNTLSDICFTLGLKPEIKLPVQKEIAWVNESAIPSILDRSRADTSNIIYRTKLKHWSKAA